MSEAAAGQVSVTVDDRARLVAAILAAGDWPEREQAQLIHAVHPHAKQTRHLVQAFAGHKAVTLANQALVDGVTVDDLFAAALRATWPDLIAREPLPPALAGSAWLPALADFYQETAVARFWQERQAFWVEAQTDLATIFAGSRLPAFLDQLRRQSLAQALIVAPNLVYPALATLLAQTQTALWLILPPPKAVGESPPWPYGEDPGWVQAQVCRRLLWHELAGELAQLTPEQQALLVHAAVTLYLEQALDEAESLAYLVRRKKEHNLPQLPQVVDKLRHYLAQPEAQPLATVVR